MITMGDYAGRGTVSIGTPEQQLRNALDRIWFIEMLRSGP